MIFKFYLSLILALVVSANAVSLAENPSSSKAPSNKKLRAAINRSIPLIEAGAAGSAKKRTCFTCHNQAMPVVVAVEARARGFSINENILQTQIKHTVAHLKRGKSNYLKGKGQGGQYLTAGYALMALQVGEWKPDEITAPVTGYLLWNKKQQHWKNHSNRPPSGKSSFTTTYLALLGLDSFATEAQTKQVVLRKKKALTWLLQAKTKDTEDRVFRLLSLSQLKAIPKQIQTAAKQLLETQQTDGGWRQIESLSSDAYATGSALYALVQSGQLSTNSTAYRRGVSFLLISQQKDGTWRVVSRSKPFQTYYESGYPYGKDQFISVAASSWATLALLMDFPKINNKKVKNNKPYTSKKTKKRPMFNPKTVIRQPRRPIVNTPVIDANKVKNEVDDNELVLGVVVNGKARAYPINMLTGSRREIINDTLGGQAIAATW